MLPFKSHMVDEVLVEYKGVGVLEDEDVTPSNQWKITSHPHHDAMALIKTADDMQEVLFSDDDLEAFKKLGYAVCHNKLDSHGKKVYIHHNMRTFKEKKL
jgi:hypothetical protein